MHWPHAPAPQLHMKADMDMVQVQVFQHPFYRNLPTFYLPLFIFSLFLFTPMFFFGRVSVVAAAVAVAAAKDEWDPLRKLINEYTIIEDCKSNF